VIVLAPMPASYGSIRGVEDEVAVMQKDASVCLLSPDEESVRAIGPNPYDPDRRGPAAIAGKLQGIRMATPIESVW